MTREERLKYCKVCKHKMFDASIGIVCDITNAPASFETMCINYDEDVELKRKEEKLSNEKELLMNSVSKEKRFANMIVDTICYYMFAFIFGIIFGIVLAMFAPQYLYIFEQEYPGFEYLFGFTMFSFYYIVSEATTGRTIGKLVTKTKVVDRDGNPPLFKTILIRTLCRFIPFEVFSFLGDDSTGWHDKFSNTMVVKA